MSNIKPQDSKSLLHTLSDRYKMHQVSVLVGAGFSRNAYEHFPLWGGLLYDLIIELYGKQINEDYVTYCHNQPPSAHIPYPDYEQRAISKIVEDKTYLGLVSEYIKKKDCREAIDVYIEKRIPYLSKRDGKFSLSTDTSYQFETKNLDVHADLLSCNWLDIYTTNYDNLLEMAAAEKNIPYDTIVSDFSLGSNAMGRNIIKLHGNLAEDSLNSDFVFDGDHSLRYIIAQEDYDTYPVKHEAFTQLMRIAMLKGVFLLVGFSGTDPNFLAWLNWVKDVLDKDPESKKDNIKIFLLLLNREPLSTEQLLYYQNHHIGVIYLDDADLLEELVGNTPSPQNKAATIESLSVKDKFRFFFKYLRNSSDDSVKQTEDYNSLWGTILEKLTRNQTLEGLRSELQVASNSLRLQKNVYWQERVIDHLYRQERIWTDDEIEFANYAMKDVGVLSAFLFADRKYEDVRKTGIWNELSVKCSVLTNDFKIIDNPTSDLDFYCNLLSYAFNLDLKGVTHTLDAWNPENHYKINWASYKSIFDQKAATDLLDEYIANESNAQEKFLASTIRNNISFTMPAVYSCAEYRNVVGFNDVRSRLVKEIKSEEANIKPHGWSGREFRLGHDVHCIRASINFINLLLETGVLTSYGFITVVGHKDWYPIFKVVFELMPYPCLFYSLQLGDEATITRIGQDYAYSEELVEKLPDMLKKVMSSIKEDSFMGEWQSFWLMMAEMSIAVDVDCWLDDFIEILEVRYFPNIRSITYSTAPYKSIKKMLGYIHNTEQVNRVLSLYLKYAGKNPIEVGDHLIELDLNINISETNLECLRSVISQLPATKSHYITVSLYENESAKQVLIPIIANKITEEDLNFSEADRWRTIHTLTYLTNNNPEAISKLKGIILQRDIWKCGIKDAHSGSNPNYFDLSKISKDIVWNKDDLEIIAQNIDKNLNLLELVEFNDDWFCNEYLDLLTSIENFIHYRVDQEFSNMFSSFGPRISAKVAKLSNDSDFFQSMSSKDGSAIEMSGNKLVALIKEYGFEKYKSEVYMCLSKALYPELKNTTFILSLIAYLAENIEDMKKEDIANMIHSILKKYAQEHLSMYDIIVPHVCKYLRDIATAYKDVLVDSAEVKYWLEDKMVNRFNV